MPAFAAEPRRRTGLLVSTLVAGLLLLGAVPAYADEAGQALPPTEQTGTPDSTGPGTTAPEATVPEATGPVESAPADPAGEPAPTPPPATQPAPSPTSAPSPAVDPAPPTSQRGTANPVPAPTLTIDLPYTAFRESETLVVAGSVSTVAGAARDQELLLQRRTADGRWVTVGQQQSNAQGRFAFAQRNERLGLNFGKFRVRWPAQGIISSPSTIVRTSGARSLEERTPSVQPLLGAARTGLATQRRYGLVVRTQEHPAGQLIEVGRNASMVRGPMLNAFTNAGGVAGRLGAPINDMTCGLMEGACIQQFQGGAIYLNSQARHPVSIGYARNRRSLILAVAKSQLGYTEPHYRGSKYGAWQGSSEAWCGMFQAWVSHASGQGNAVPKAHVFTRMVEIVRQRGGLLQRPQVGTLAFYGRTPWHVGLVIAVRGDRIVTLEGNVDDSGGSDFPRGVRKVIRSVGQVNFYAKPRFTR